MTAHLNSLLIIYLHVLSKHMIHWNLK